MDIVWTQINWWAFLGVVVAAYVIPGPDFAVILRSATGGARPGAAAALGAQGGLCVHMLLAALGLSVLLAHSPQALNTVRYAGAAYLIYLGLRLIVGTLRDTSTTPRQQESKTKKAAPRTAFLLGLGTNLLNPKAILFFASVLPQFISDDGSVRVQILLLGTVDVLLGFAVWAVVILFGVKLTTALSKPPARRWWDRATGGALVGLGGALATTRL